MPKTIEEKRAYQRQYRADHPEKFAKYEKVKTARRAAWRKANPETHALNKRRQNLWQTYRLTIEQVDEMVRAQDFQCLTCGTDVTADPCVDHCHETNQVRGILCRRCNLALGLTKDSPATLRAMAEYLERQNPLILS